MLAKATACGVRLRPHFKTHQSIGIGRWFAQAGVDAIAVSSVSMAAYFSEDGWRDITIAFPVNVREMKRIDRLAKVASIGCLVESVEAVLALHAGLSRDVDIWLKVDTGYGRTGVSWDDADSLCRIIDKVKKSPRLAMRGLLAHAGHSYEADTTKQIIAVNAQTVARMIELRDRLAPISGDLEISIGDTPCCSVADNFDGVDEMRPGNFVFYDVMQSALGSCKHSQIAVALACPVVAVHEERNEIVVHGGAIHLSKEHLLNADGARMFGQVVTMNDDGWGPPVDGAYVKKISQEHGVIFAPRDLIEKIETGDLLGVLPVHSCLTANLMGGYTTPDGDLIDHMNGHGD